MELIDNNIPIPEPILSNVEEYLAENINSDDHCDLIKAAQYGYNIAQVFVDDLKKEMIEINERFEKIFTEKNAEIFTLKNQVEDLTIANQELKK